MRERVAKSRRPFRYELYSLMAVFAIPIGLMMAFPFEVLNFHPQEVSAAPSAGCAFLSLSEEEVAYLVANARAAWEMSGGTTHGRWSGLSLVEIPEEVSQPVMSIDFRSRVALPEPRMYGDAPLPPSQAAKLPQRITPNVAPVSGEKKTFSRNELLKLD